MKSKYIIIILITIIVLCSALFYIIHANSERKISQNFLSQQSNRVDYMTLALNDYLSERLNIASVISFYLSFQYMDMGQIERDIQSYYKIEKNNSVQDVSVYDKNGMIIYSTSQQLIGSINSKSDFFQWAKNKKNHNDHHISIEPNIKDSLNKDQSNLNLLLTTPIYNTTNDANNLQDGYEFMGVITTTIKLDEILSSFSALLGKYSLTENFYILESSGTLIFSNSHPEMVLNNINSYNSDCYRCHESFSHFETILSKNKGATIDVANNIRVSSSFNTLTLNNIQWKIVIWIPSSEVSGVINENFYLTLILSLLYLLSIIITGILIINSNKQKIKLEEESKQLKQKLAYEESLNISEEKFESLIEQSPFVIEVYDLNGLQISVNRAYEKLWGFPGKTTLYKFNILKGKQVEDTGLIKYVKQAYAGETVTLPEYLFDPTGDTEAKGVGRVRWLSTKIYPTKDVSEKVVNIVVMHQDITDRKLAEDEMVKLAAVVKHSSELVNLSTLDGRMIFLNKSGSEMLGIEPDEVENVNIIDVIPDDYKGLANNIVIPTLMKGETWEGDLQYQNMSTGKLIDVHSITFPIKDTKTGEPLYLANVSQDVSERIHDDKIQKLLYNISHTVSTAEDLIEFLDLVQKELSSVIDTTNFYVALYDAETNLMSLPLFKDTMDKVTSFPAEKTLTHYLIKGEKSLLVNKADIIKLEKSREIDHFGTYAEIWLGVPLKIGRKIIGAMVVQSYNNEAVYNESDKELLEFVSEHISILIDRKNTVQELEDALVKASEADHLKSVFLATMSHELKTPISAIIGFSEIVNKNMPIEQILQYIGKINSCGDQLQKIVENIFDITLIESGQTKIYKEKILLQTVLDEVCEIIKFEQERINKMNLDLILMIPDENKGLIAYTDSTILKQILINLLKNAFKFTKSGSVDFGFDIESYHEKSMLRFYVKDTGIGINREDYENVFELFRQAEDSQNRTYGGTGIGLFIAKKLTKLLGGTIWLESEINRGSTFYFTIPNE